MTVTAAPGCQLLTQEQVDHFVEHGWVVVHDCFDKAHADWMMRDIWTRMGVDPNDKSTWTKGKFHTHGGRYHLPAHRVVKIEQFAPRAHQAMCDLVGGEGKFVDETYRWYDNPIVSLGDDEDEKKTVAPPDPYKGGWHIDGGSFKHFLDAPEVTLLVVPIYSDVVKSGGGATYICPDSVSKVAQYLLEHPEGTRKIDFGKIASECSEFVELTAKLGDVVLVHPFMLHTGSANILREPRFMANPCMSLKEPFRYDKPWDQLNPIEQSTLRALGLKGKTLEFKITGEREIFLTSDRYTRWQEQRQYEIDNLKKIGHHVDFEIDSEILTNPNIVTL